MLLKTLIRNSFAAFVCALLLTGCSRPPTIPLSLKVHVHLPADSTPSGSQTFIPAEVALPVTFTLSPAGAIPPDGRLFLRVIDQKGTEYQRRSWPIPPPDGETITVSRLFRITHLPGSRYIILQAGIGDQQGGMYATAHSETGPWQDVVSGYALYNTISLSDGWYLPESDRSFTRGCNGACAVHFARPLFPSVLHLKGSAPVRCFENESWTLTVSQNTHPVYRETITKNDFECSITIAPPGYSTDCHSGDLPWPAGEIELEIASDKTFDPLACQGINDNRTLAFHVTYLEKGDFLPKRGFYGPRESDRHYWPAPDCTVLLPVYPGNTVLHIQGRRDMDCVKEPQSMTLFLNGFKLGTHLLEPDVFTLTIPSADVLQNAHPYQPAELKIIVSPIFFRTLCRDTDDPNPYGVGIDDICFRPAIPGI
jgi:hypothetical protein